MGILGVNMKKLICFILFFICFMLNAKAHDIRFVQVSDVRYSKSDNQTLQKTVSDINKINDVDFVVFTGDNIHRANVDELKSFLKEARKLKAPFYLAIGDKDVNKHKDLSKKEYARIARRNIKITKNGYINYVIEKNGVVFLVVDGARDVIPTSNGYYKDDVVDWVSSNLDKYKDKNVIILQHFPLIPPEDRENYVTFKPQKYLETLHNHTNVKAVISGHFDVNKEISAGGITHISTAFAPNYRVIDIIDCDLPNSTIWAEVKVAE